MPTENRSSNTEQMVSVPREWVENYAGLLEERCAYEASERVQALLAQPAAQHQGEAEGYPPCDYCGLTPSYHPWHGSGLLEGVENRHIHACNKCRGKLPTHQVEPVASIPDGYCLMPRRLTAENGAKALLLGEFKLQVTCECPECQELEEPLEGCEVCDGEGEYAQRHTIPWDQIKFIYSEAVKGLALQRHAVL